ncbi:uncharacterized protein LOC129218662 [Uloborus diversus]|uniref:uncharacterized protein LOC129218662 n=1 Tax=Uloborus diversus TaxID=327109 RepID=UPI0024092677|nr:uncharacterized protein LOC129218662 [Uloborus diversus]
MAYPANKYCRRQKACLVVSVFLLILGLLQLCLGILLSLKSRNRKCHKSRYMLIGIYLVVAGISGVVGYYPRKTKSPYKVKRIRGSRASAAVFVIFCALVTLLVILEGNAFSCTAPQDVHSHETSVRIYAILGLVEVTGMHVAHLLSALCVGLACPDLWASNSSSTSKTEKYSNSGTKKTNKQAIHLPDARTHVQEAAGTSDKITVVSLPETDGIVYAVPEEQYVIRRGDATYLAPPGNTHLTPFFPTYRSQVD